MVQKVIGFYSSAKIKGRVVKRGVRNPKARVMSAGNSKRYISQALWARYGKSSLSGKSQWEKSNSKKSNKTKRRKPRRRKTKVIDDEETESD